MAGIKEEKKIYLVGIYCRLSKDDGTDNESASIATQKSILTDYVKRQGWHLAKTYVDDGYSGTNFQRPSFQNMIKDIENGLINCVITKDLSRLGRNYLDCGLYLEVFFPEHNVRYIAVNDGVDTLNKSAMDITPFRNILNEMYSADVSVKIKSAYRARFQQGKFMGTYAPYGYIKDPADHNHLLIDDKVAHVVREIFDLALAGNGISKIRKHINKQHILRPAAYAAEQGAAGYERYFEGNEENRYIWSENSVRGILRSPIYAGNLAGYKRIAANMKSKKRPSKLPEEWEVIPDTHEGIVTQEEFDTVQQLITSRRLPENKGGFENIFAGVIKCADCGYALRAMSANRRKRPDIIDCVQYTCNNYGRYGNVMCTAHAIEARDLFNAVLADINRFADMAVNDERAVRAIEKRLTETDQSKAKAMEKERKKLNKRLAELDRLFSSLYEDKVMERITERNFEMMSGKYQKEQLEIEARLKEVTETLNESYEKSQGIRDFLSLIRNYQGIKELDATIINALIDKILVSEREKSADGTVKQEIKIYYKFIGFVGELHITPTKRWTALPPKNCMVCGVEYVPGSGISKYCPACAKKIQREKSNDSKRRSREQKRMVCIELSAKNDRLISATYDGTTTTYTYDAVGNRLTRQKGTETAETYTYNYLNQLTRVQQDTAVTTYTYDARGNQTQQVQTGTGVTTTSTYGYDLANRLISSGISNNAVVPFSTSATYAYNAQGQRVTRVEDEVVTHFYYTGSALLFTTVNEYVLQTQNILDPAGSIVASKRFEGQAATGQDPYADDYFFYRYDVRGSVTTIVDGTGAVVKSYDYDEFGVTTSTGDTFHNEVTFTGSVADASGLLYMNARYYNPSTARFLSQDSYTGSASVPWTQHLYAYCNNNPVNMVDPTGHWAMRPFTVNINDGGGGRANTPAVTPTPGPQPQPTPSPTPTSGTAADREDPLPVPLPTPPAVPDRNDSGGTLTVGISGQAEAGLSLGASVGYTWDRESGAVQFSPAIGGGTVELSGGLFLMVTDAPDIDTLCRSVTNVTGGTILFIGYDLVTMYDPVTQNTYSGSIITISGSPLTFVSLEYHSQVSWTFNIG